MPIRTRFDRALCLRLVAALALTPLAACGGGYSYAPGDPIPFNSFVPGSPLATGGEDRRTASRPAGPLGAEMPPAAPAPPATPLGAEAEDWEAPVRVDLSRPPHATDVELAILRQQAIAAGGRRIIVSRYDRYLWLIEDDRVLFRAPVAVGRDTVFSYGDQSWNFATPAGVLQVRDKEPLPEWVPPDWHYFELAVERELEPVRLSAGSVVPLSDGTRIEVRGNQVGRVNQYGNFRAFTPGTEIIFDGMIFMPPLGSAQRRVPEVLGTHRLILGDGYLIHGTPDEDSIGQYASHGCVRMLNRDIEQLYGMVDPGTAVYIY